jgi:hypothetical protein
LTEVALKPDPKSVVTVVPAPCSERAMHLGDILNEPVKALCYCGEVKSVREFRDQENHGHSIIVSEHSDGQFAVFIAKEDSSRYNKHIGMLNAQEWN